jgi:hypothetical protein
MAGGNRRIMSEKMTYYDRLFKESDEEKEIQKLLDEERASYENTEAYKEHISRLNDLFERLKVAGQKRREEAKKYKPKRRPTTKHMTEKEKADFREQTRKEKEARIDSYPEPLRNVIRTYEGLDDQAKKVFQKETWVYEPDCDDYKDPVTTEKDLSELLDILVQTTIDFINERNLTDIDSIGFGADGLQESADAGEWVAYTDANIYATGLGTVKGKDGHEYTVSQKIGSYM